MKDAALLIIRLVFGLGMLFGHGWGKMLKLFAGPPFQFGDPLGVGTGISLGLAVFAEVVCAFLIIIGFWSRWASIPLIITMLVAIFVVHWDDPFGQKEKAILYLTGYLSILLAGSGWYSIEEQIRK